MEAKKQTNQETPMASQPGIAPSGNNQINTMLIFFPFSPSTAFVNMLNWSFSHWVSYGCGSSDFNHAIHVEKNWNSQTLQCQGRTCQLRKCQKHERFSGTQLFFPACTNEWLGWRHELYQTSVLLTSLDRVFDSGCTRRRHLIQSSQCCLALCMSYFDGWQVSSNGLHLSKSLASLSFPFPACSFTGSSKPMALFQRWKLRVH